MTTRRKRTLPKPPSRAERSVDEERMQNRRPGKQRNIDRSQGEIASGLPRRIPKGVDLPNPQPKKRYSDKGIYATPEKGIDDPVEFSRGGKAQREQYINEPRRHRA